MSPVYYPGCLRGASTNIRIRHYYYNHCSPAEEGEVYIVGGSASEPMTNIGNHMRGESRSLFINCFRNLRWRHIDAEEDVVCRCVSMFILPASSTDTLGSREPHPALNEMNRLRVAHMLI